MPVFCDGSLAGERVGGKNTINASYIIFGIYSIDLNVHFYSSDKKRVEENKIIGSASRPNIAGLCRPG